MKMDCVHLIEKNKCGECREQKKRTKKLLKQALKRALGNGELSLK
jgi:hypothetical protein